MDNETTTDKNQLGQLPYQEEWYEDSMDLNLKAFSLTEDEWQNQEERHFAANQPLDGLSDS